MDEVLMSKKARLLLEFFVDEMKEELIESDDATADALFVMQTMANQFLPIAAMYGSVKSHPEYDSKQTMVHMGNFTVCQAIMDMDDNVFELMDKVVKRCK